MMSSLEATYNDEYSVKYAQTLGDEYKEKSVQKEETKLQNFLSAKLLYSLVTKTGNINEHPINAQQKGDIDRNKLSQLKTFKKQYNIRLNYDKQETCPRQVLSVLKSFYSPWLIEAKSKLKQRSQLHIIKRYEAFVQVYEQMIDLYRCNNNHDSFKSNLQNIRREMLQLQHDYIDNEWKGPDFRHLQLKKVRGEYLDELTAVYDKKGYLKRCNNSQEDWLRKYHGEFLAKCITNAKRIFDANLKMKLHFGQLLLTKTVRFNASRDTDLIPGGWIFGPSCDLLATALTQLLGINIKAIKQNGGSGRHKDRLRETLLNELDTKFEQVNRTSIITPPPRPPPPNTNYTMNNGNNTQMRPHSDTFYDQRQEFPANNSNNNNNGNAQQWISRDRYDQLSQEHQQLKVELARCRQQLMMNQGRQSPVSDEATPGPTATSSIASTTPTSPSVYSIETMPTQTSTSSCNQNPPPNKPPPPQFHPIPHPYPHSYSQPQPQIQPQLHPHQNGNMYSTPINMAVPLPSAIPVAPMNVNVAHHHHHHVAMQPAVIMPQPSMESSHPIGYIQPTQNRGYGGYKSSHGASRSVKSERYNPYFNPYNLNRNYDDNDINGYMVQQQQPIIQQAEVPLYGAGIITNQYDAVSSTPFITDSQSIAGESMITNNGVNQRQIHLNSLF